jgi:peptidyl-Asp metalloendopeptidase
MMCKLLILPVLLASVLLAAPASAQQTPFLVVANGANLTPQQSEALSGIRALRTTARAVVVRVNTDALRDSDKISIPLETKSVSIQNDSRRSSDGNMFWIGAAPNETKGSTTLVASQQNVTGSIQTVDGSYRIWPLGDGLHALVKVNTNNLPPEHPPSSK